MVACKQGHLGIVKTLLETEANVNQANKVLLFHSVDVSLQYLCSDRIHYALCYIVYLEKLMLLSAIPFCNYPDMYLLH